MPTLKQLCKNTRTMETGSGWKGKSYRNTLESGMDLCPYLKCLNRKLVVGFRKNILAPLKNIHTGCFVFWFIIIGCGPIFIISFRVNQLAMRIQYGCPSGSETTLGLSSLSGRTYYHKISWSLEAASFGFRLFQSLWNLTGTSAAVLPMCLSNFRAIRSIQHPISRLRDFARFGGKTSYRLMHRGTEGYKWMDHMDI